MEKCFRSELGKMDEKDFKTEIFAIRLTCRAVACQLLVVCEVTGQRAERMIRYVATCRRGVVHTDWIPLP